MHYACSCAACFEEIHITLNFLLRNFILLKTFLLKNFILLEIHLIRGLILYAPLSAM